jgi:hypothetical protein
VSTLSERFGRATNALYPHLVRRAGEELATVAPRGGVHLLAGHTHLTIVSYRRSERAVATPVWFGVANGRAYAWPIRDAAGCYVEILPTQT